MLRNCTFIGVAGVNLQREDAVHLPLLRIVVGHVDHQLAVDLLDEVIAVGDDVVLVPVVLLDGLRQFVGVAELLDDLRLVVRADDGLLAAQGEDAAAALVVEDAGVLVLAVHVGLVAADDPLADLLRLLAAAILHAGVGEARIGHAELELQLEIGRLAAAPDQKGVALGGILGGGLAGDRAVFDAPELGIAVPALKRLAVEDRLEAFVARGGAASDQQHDKQSKAVFVKRCMVFS